ncbi:hypothetical protein FZCC0069_05500 [Rhodobacterales bacterium FZCC0069]|nr:hypothetical protein [Rhodobacterales bacterium FZCC0069]
MAQKQFFKSKILRFSLIVLLALLIFGKLFFYFLQELLQFYSISEVRAAQLKTAASLVGVTGLLLVLYGVPASKITGVKNVFTKFNQVKEISFIFMAALIFLFCLGNIGNPNFWLDEAGQIWISLGLNHFSPPFSDPANLQNVYLNNNNYNMDPGGFTYLLHFWLYLGTSPIFLRILPFLFSLGVITLSYYLLKTSFVKGQHVILLPPVFFGSQVFMQYSFELRAYSFEMLVALSALALAIQSKKILGSSKSSLIFGLWLAFGLSSRYSAVFPVSVAIAFVAFDAIRINHRRAFINALFLIVPVLCSAALIFSYVLINQNPGGDPPEYVSNFFIVNMGFFEIFFAPRAILVWAPMVLLFIWSITLRSSHYLRRYLVFSFILLMTLLIASVFEKYPLLFYSRFDASIHIVLWFGWAIIGSLFLSAASRVLSSEKYFLLISYLASVMFIFALFARYNPNDSLFDNFAMCINYDEPGLIMANEGSIPTIKYLFELGPLKDFELTYGDIYFFSEGLDESSIAMPIESVEIENYQYFIFSFFDKESDLYSEIIASSDFIRCNDSGPSEIYLRSGSA